jgi:splicing suppressor protein 51
VPNPFTRLDEGTYLHRRPDKDVYRLLIDTFRMRSEDDSRLENKPTPNSIYTGKPSSIEPFKKFLALAATRRGLLPPWWDAEHQRECEKWAESGEWNDVRKKVTKAQMIQHYGDEKAPMQLRMLAEAVYGVGSMGQNGAGMRGLLRQMESGGPGNGMITSMMDVSNLMGGER